MAEVTSEKRDWVWGWQPIEFAPRDGSPQILRVESLNYAGQPAGMNVQVCYFTGAGTTLEQQWGASGSFASGGFCRITGYLPRPDFDEPIASISEPATPASAMEVLRRVTHALEILNERPRPMCRDCADNDGMCPNSCLPCDMQALIASARALVAANKDNPS